MCQTMASASRSAEEVLYFAPNKNPSERTLLVEKQIGRLFRPPAPTNDVKYLRASPAEMPFRNWYTASCALPIPAPFEGAGIPAPFFYKGCGESLPLSVLQSATVGGSVVGVVGPL